MDSTFYRVEESSRSMFPVETNSSLKHYPEAVRSRTEFQRAHASRLNSLAHDTLEHGVVVGENSKLTISRSPTLQRSEQPACT